MTQERLEKLWNKAYYTYLDNDEAEELINYYKKMEQENKQLKELKYKFFDNCGDEESFTLEDYLEISNKLYDYEEENKQLKEEVNRLKRNVEEYIYEHRLYQQEIDNYKNILTELEQYYKEQLEFIVELPVYTKDIAQEHKVMELCYEDFLNKIQELKEKYK